MFHKDFYPTPPELIEKMVQKVENFGDIKTVLDPSAGKGDILKYVKEHTKYHNRKTLYAIEIIPELQSILRGIGDVEKPQFGARGPMIHVIDSDFLQYFGMEQFDLILANFPFSDGTLHLSKALDIMFSGQIVCLLNAESIRNPKTNHDLMLVQRLQDLGAEIEYLKEAFVQAERTTSVEVALISVKIERTVETDLFKDMDEEMDAQRYTDDDSGYTEDLNSSEVSARNSIEFLVKRYDDEREFVRTMIINFYSKYSQVNRYLALQVLGAEGFDGETETEGSDETLTGAMKHALNRFSMNIKEKYWRDVLDLDEVKSRMTSEKRTELLTIMERSFRVEFTEANIRQFILNLMEEYPQMLRQMITMLFDTFTRFALVDESYGNEEYKKHIHYYNAWKGNSAFKIQGKVIIPISIDLSWDKKDISLGYEAGYFLDDLDIVMSYFSDLKPAPVKHKGESDDKSLAKQGYFRSTRDIVRDALNSGQNKSIDSQFFLISVFKKGTIHLKFKDEDLMRRFNLEACKGKNFIPSDYSEKAYEDLDEAGKNFVNSFEGKKNYKQISHGKTIKCLGDLGKNSFVQIGYFLRNQKTKKGT